MRKLSSIRTILRLEAIEDADKLELALIDGWQVVVKKGDYSEGQEVLYIEPDAWVPTELAPFLSKNPEKPSEYLGIKGEKLKTRKIRGVISQGLVLPVPQNCTAETDLDKALNIVKWESFSSSGDQSNKGSFPSFLVKTDQVRVQNLKQEVLNRLADKTWEISEKIEGCSMTVFNYLGNWGICSRNLQVEEDSINSEYSRVAKDLDLKNRIPENFAFQGELVGPKIQGNIYKLASLDFLVFDIFNIEKQEYLDSFERVTLLKKLGIKSVPILEVTKVPAESFNSAYLLNLADGYSALKEDTLREGLVFKSLEKPADSFKVISKLYELKN